MNISHHFKNSFPKFHKKWLFLFDVHIQSHKNYTTQRSTASPNDDGLMILQKGKIEKIAVQSFLDQCRQYPSVHIDLGTGDGKYVYREARKNKEAFFIGIDQSPSAAHISWKADRKPSRGGIKNVAFIVSAVENLSRDFQLLADSITINYPWSSLLKNIVSPDQPTLKTIHRIGKPNSSLDIRLNYTIFSNPSYIAKLDLPQVNEEYIQKHLIPKYLNVAIHIKKYTIGKNTTNTGTWGQHLTLASGRDTLHLHCIIKRLPNI